MSPPYRIPMAQPDLTLHDAVEIGECIRRGWITQGPLVRSFEAQFAASLGVRHAIAVSSGTAALHLALLAAGVKPGDRVLVPTLTYVATVAAVRYCGAVPVFMDVDPETWGLADSFRGHAVDHTLPVHLYGVPSQVWSDSIEDCAESLGATTNGGAMPTGKAGRLGIFSFYGNKILTTGEGGMVVTDDDGLAEEVRLLRGQGQDPNRRYWHTRVGYNYRMTDLQAALGVGQLERLPEMLGKRHALHERYVQQLRHSVEIQRPRPGTTAAPWVFACLLPTGGRGRLGIQHRDSVMLALAAHGIETRPTFPCVHQMPPYKEFAVKAAYIGEGMDGENVIDRRQFTSYYKFPIAEDIAARGLLLPLYSQMTLDEVDEVCDRLRSLL